MIRTASARMTPARRCRGVMAALLSVVAMIVAAPFSAGKATATDAAPDTLEKIRETGVIRIGHRQSEPPFSYIVNEEPTGYSLELCSRIVDLMAERLNLPKIKIEYLVVSSATRFVMMRSGKIDMECAATTNNAERRKLVAFSFPHFVTATRFVSLKEAKIQKIADLAGRSVAATTGTVNLDQLNAINRERGLNISILLNKENAGAFSMVTSGKASAFVMDDILLAGQIAAATNPEAYVLSQETFSRPEPYGILLPLGDTAFKEAVNESIRTIYASGEIYRMYEKWFEQPIPPKGQNMKLPMSPELRAVFDTPEEYKE
ncbi:amino acid ABC transporter substrate-binding protein [Affinirhizobium pseudoryzae]|uniref:amino acid ABC transporter substrate-binding protein n=1 Tax=Allorhizobium pseudoryzae TaxID=379684 RepID=UPI001F3FF124|nr:amino acid ABC transporter substrate-binding protein [Allorhizobium pseudoryzae]